MQAGIRPGQSAQGIVRRGSYESETSYARVDHERTYGGYGEPFTFCSSRTVLNGSLGRNFKLCVYDNQPQLPSQFDLAIQLDERHILHLDLSRNTVFCLRKRRVCQLGVWRYQSSMPSGRRYKHGPIYSSFRARLPGELFLHVHADNVKHQRFRRHNYLSELRYSSAEPAKSALVCYNLGQSGVLGAERISCVSDKCQLHQIILGRLDSLRWERDGEHRNRERLNGTGAEYLWHRALRFS